jgi:hypothetical protein
LIFQAGVAVNQAQFDAYVDERNAYDSCVSYFHELVDNFRNDNMGPGFIDMGGMNADWDIPYRQLADFQRQYTHLFLEEYANGIF